MKKTMRAITVAIVAAASGTAMAADFPRGPTPYYSTPSPAPLTYNWAGLYAGANLGYQWSHVTGSNLDPNGIAGGAQLGYNWQWNQFVLGVETDIQASAADDTFAPWKFSNPWFGTLRGRAGYALNNILFYGTLGFAYGALDGQLNALSEDKTLTGWTGGAGMEVGFNSHWSAKVEYLYMDLGDRAYSITGTNNGLQSNLLRFGVNYHF
ncbi:MAG: porin family protein [Pseudolabrys sp.]|jgi:outer membrane immunogenic protein